MFYRTRKNFFYNYQLQHLVKFVSSVSDLFVDHSLNVGRRVSNHRQPVRLKHKRTCLPKWLFSVQSHVRMCSTKVGLVVAIIADLEVL